MEEIIKQELQYFSNTPFSLPNHQRLNLPRYDRHTSFSELSDWSNSDKLASTRLPKIYSERESSLKTKIKTNISTNNNPCCPIKQMDINLESLKNLEESFYCQYLKDKSKNQLKQIQFVTTSHRQKKRSTSNGQVLSVGKLREIIKRQKNSRISGSIEDYLRTTQLFKKTPRPKQES